MSKLNYIAAYRNKKGDCIEVQVPVLIFEENSTHFAYSPSLNITGYGKTVIDAKNSFKITLEEYINYTTAKNTLVKDLKKHNWIVTKS